VGEGASRTAQLARHLPAPLPTLSDFAVLTAWAKSREASALCPKLRQATLPTLRVGLKPL